MSAWQLVASGLDTKGHWYAADRRVYPSFQAMDDHRREFENDVAAQHGGGITQIEVVELEVVGS
jgi:myo-inositol catabolism protein IolC